MVKICIHLQLFAKCCPVALICFNFYLGPQNINTSFLLFLFPMSYIYLIHPSIHLSAHPSFCLWLSTSMALRTIVKSAIQFWGFYQIVFNKHLTIVLKRRVGQREGQAVSQGVASECSAPTGNLSAHTFNLQNIKDKPAAQPAKKRATPYCVHVVCLLNHRGWKQLI